MAALPPRADACPGLAHMAAALDGGICRLRLPGGVLTASQARIVAQASRTFGNGVIELTNRANLQLRGVRVADATRIGLQHTPPPLIAVLTAAGFGPPPIPEQEGAACEAASPVTATALATADAVRNILISPMAGCDRSMRVDTRPLLAASLARLAHRIARGEAPVPSLPLSAKFAIQIDGGEALTVLGHHHDIWFCALDTSLGDMRGTTDRSEQCDGGDWFAFGLASSIPCDALPPINGNDRRLREPTAHARVDPAIGLLRAADVAAAIDALVAHFLHLRATGCARDRDGRTAARLRDILAPSDHAARRAYVDAAFMAVGLDATFPSWLMQWRRPRPTPDASRKIGLLRQRATLHTDAALDAQPEGQALGLHTVLGRLGPAQLDALADLSERYGDGSLRITPWQGVILPNIKNALPDAASQALDAARDVGLIVDAHDPTTRLHACAGSTGCAKAGADTKADALRIAARFSERDASVRPPVDVHLTGCERRCASAVPREFTLIALRPNRYALHRWNDALRHDALLCSDVDIDAAADRILKETASP